MKHLAVLCSLLFAGCVMDVEAGDEQTATEQSEIEIVSPPPIVLVPTRPLAVSATQSTTPAIGSVTPSMIWPLTRGISSVEVVYRRGPDRTGGPTFLAFVIWNGNYIAHIFCSYYGAAGNQLRDTIDDTLATRSSLGPDLGAGTTGSGTGGGVVHPPRPNVFPDGEVVFTSTYLDGVKDQATTALRLSNPRVALPGAPIYEISP